VKTSNCTQINCSTNLASIFQKFIVMSNMQFFPLFKYVTRTNATKRNHRKFEITSTSSQEAKTTKERDDCSCFTGTKMTAVIWVCSLIENYARFNVLID
jgi:hypothetical protein